MELYSTDVARRLKREATALARARGIGTPRYAKVALKAPLREPREIDASAFVWWVARCTPGFAFKVADDFSKNGYCGYAPAGRKIVIPRGPNKNGKGKRIVEFPVFGSYVFIGDCNCSGVYASAHEKIEGILGESGRPLPAPWRAIQILNALDCAGHWGGRMDIHGDGAPFRRGDLVRVSSGPLAELCGIVKDMRGAAKAVIEMTLFGQPTEVKIDACNLESV